MLPCPALSMVSGRELRFLVENCQLVSHFPNKTIKHLQRAEVKSPGRAAECGAPGGHGGT
jgi:hypothetical protein